MRPLSALCFVSMMAAGASLPSQPVAAKSDPLAQSSQLIVVTTPDWSALQGRLQRYERTGSDKPWRPVSEAISIVVGKNGLGWGIGVIPTDDRAVRAASDPVKHEGDGKVPAGIFALGTAFGYAPQPLEHSKMPYLALTPSTECVDDMDSKHYNRIVDRSSVTPDWNSSEAMRNAGESYLWGIAVDHNRTVDSAKGAPPTRRGGSCIFLHIWKSAQQGTVGCTAMPQAELEGLLLWIDPKRNPLLVQLPEKEYVRLAGRWKLPTATSPSAAH